MWSGDVYALLHGRGSGKTTHSLTVVPHEIARATLVARSRAEGGRQWKLSVPLLSVAAQNRAGTHCLTVAVEKGYALPDGSRSKKPA
jgi:hypothetical protein